uniref:Uncharacterized protein n=1 Tax=Trichobilharzia regenti TaxID=157069 RepID=A0AA85K598_TRIRE|nr:unnamed protein product [Trichobilharzia regenti]
MLCIPQRRQRTDIIDELVCASCQTSVSVSHDLLLINIFPENSVHFETLYRIKQLLLLLVVFRIVTREDKGQTTDRLVGKSRGIYRFLCVLFSSVIVSGEATSSEWLFS